MEDFDPDEYLAESDLPDTSDFDPDEYLGRAPGGPSALDSAGRGFVQGTTAGFADELGGAIQGGLDKVYGLFGDSPTEVNERLQREGFTGDIGPTSSGGMYKQGRDEMRALDQEAKKANPGMYMAGEIGGGILSAAATPGLNIAKGAKLATVAGKSGLAGGAAGLGLSDADLTEGEYGQAALDTAKGAALGAAFGTGTELAGRGLKYASTKLPDVLQKFAEKAAVNATGATGKQAANFSEDAGRELLDRGIVRFGDSQSKIATRAGDAVSAANAQIDDALKTLEAGGAKVDANDIYNAVRSKIDELRGDPSQADVARLLENELDNLLNATDSLGSTELGVGAAEKIKRGYNRKAGNWADPEKGAVGKEMYQTFRHGVEDAAQAADPATAQLFEEGKKTFGLLRPIEEAAERRAATTAQSPVGGLLDMTSLASGVATGNPLTGVAMAGARKMVAPRVSSSVAVSADTLSKVLRSAPQKLGKFTRVLQQAEQRGPQGVAATHFVLQQSNPEYRQVLKDVADNPDEEPGYDY